jgi:hypothetical protein
LGEAFWSLSNSAIFEYVWANSPAMLKNAIRIAGVLRSPDLQARDMGTTL